ncbi:MAG TPA: FHA domain-containing protein [Acidimicrobiales bacterium]|nr:FHA domain-containing protein [Acidimicrobiales bacterium]
MPDQLLNLLKLFLLVLLYLFFLRVLRAVWTEVNVSPVAEAPAAAPRPRGRARRGGRPIRASQPQLRALEPANLRGQSFPLAEEVTLGRAAGCQVPLDDAYASQVHARVFQRDGQWYVEDLGSTNGTYLNRRRVAGPMVIKRRDKLQIGNTVLELQ